MKRALLIIALLALFVQPVPAQKEHRTYIPYIINPQCEGESMSTWKIIVPEATTNNCLNPSAEIAGNFANVGGGAVTRVNTTQFFDVYSYRVVTAANNQGGSFTLLALSNNIHYVTMRVSGTLPTAWDWSLDNAAYTAPVLIEDIDGVWSLYGLEFPAAQANGSTLLYVRQNGAGAGDFNLDGIQVEQKTYWTTFCDGTRQGCEWNGAEHASTSARSAQSRAGGRVQDLEDDYNFRVGSFISTGLPPVTNTVDSYAILPGGELNAVKVESRIFTLTGVIQGTSVSNLHANRQSLLNVLKPNAVAHDENGAQPARIRYTGAAVQKQISAHYQGGLETRIEATLECWERLAVRFLSDDPYWYEIGDSADVLDSNDTATLRYVAGRLKSTGQWDDLGLTNNPTANGNTFTVLVASDRSVYFGGNFQGMNNVAGRDYIARYIPSSDTWETVGGAGDFNNQVVALIEGPDGTIYAGGLFTNVAGVAAADYIAQWDGNNWTAVGVPVAGAAAIVSVLSFAFNSQGILYIGGLFDNWANIAAADTIVSWNGAAYSAVGVPGIGGLAYFVTAIAVDSNDNVYIGGDFLNFGGDADADYLALWNGASWSAVADTALNNPVQALTFTDDDILYIGGEFTDLAGIADADYIARFNGTAFFALSTGLDGSCNGMFLAPDGILYIAGAFSEAGGITLSDRFAKWNGSSWAHLDLNLPGAAGTRAIATSLPDPIIPRNYDVWIGFQNTGAGFFSGDITVSNDGTESSFPKFVISRSGGTSAILEQIRNETTGQELLFDYSLLDGETLTIDLTPTSKSIISNFFGSRFDAILANSDFGTFAFQPGNNLVTCFVDVAGGPTITAFTQWDDKFWSND